MNLYITSAYKSHLCLNRMRELYQMDIHGLHHLTMEPSEADAILFVENTQFQDVLFKKLLKHPLLQMYPEKVYMYNEMDRAWPILPGLYCSLSARMAGYSEHVAFPYLNAANSGIQGIFAGNTQRKWLYSFVGSSSHPIRKQLLSLSAYNARIADTSEFCTWNPAQTSKYSYQKLYSDTMAESKFVLCPRGIGPASLRLYETIEAGRVPVIISDSWVAPPQIDWGFAVRIPEWDIDSIPDRLAAIEPEWEERGLAARHAWESRYAPEHMFNTMASSIENISRSAKIPDRSLSLTVHKWRVALEQEARNWLKPPSSIAATNSINARNNNSSFLHALLGRLFSKKA